MGNHARELDKLPAGDVSLQLLLRVPGRSTVLIAHDLTVEPTLPTVTFPSDAPTNYVRGSGQSIAFNVDGTMPTGGVVKVTAYSQDAQSVVQTFTHEVSAEPWQIDTSKLDALPRGQVALRLERVIPGESTTTATHTITVQEPAVNVSFASDAPATYRLGSGAALPFAVDGTLPSDGSILIEAWSKDQNRLIDAFTYEMTAGPWEISTAHINTLSAGDVQLRVTAHIPGQSQTTAQHDLTIQPPLPTVTFATDAPANYVRGSGQSIAFNVDGVMPSDGVVKVTAYSQDTQSVVQTFTHELSAEPWQISAAKLDLLPTGQMELRWSA